jgi:hypothetical protein
MSILSIYNEQLSPELTSFLTDIKPNVDSYVTSKNEAQKQRMLIIGQVSEYKQEHKQRSADHRLLNKTMESEGWKEVVISENLTAYQEYKLLSGNVNEPYRKFAEGASVSLLTLLGRDRRNNNGGSELSAAAFDHWKKTGKYPTVSQAKGFLGGFTTKAFEFKGGGAKKATTFESCDVRTLEDDSESCDVPRLDVPIVDVVSTPVVEERSSIARPDEMVSANAEPTVIVQSPTTTTNPVKDELTVLYQSLEALLLSKRREIQDNPEALAVLQWMSQLNHNYFGVTPTVGRR